MYQIVPNKSTVWLWSFVAFFKLQGNVRLGIKLTLLGTHVTKRTARATTRVATQHSSPTPHFDQGCLVGSNYILHGLYIVVYEPTQLASFSIPVKSVSFNIRCHRACAIARLVSQLRHINLIPNAARALPVASENSEAVWPNCPPTDPLRELLPHTKAFQVDTPGIYPYRCIPIISTIMVSLTYE